VRGFGRLVVEDCNCGIRLVATRLPDGIHTTACCTQQITRISQGGPLNGKFDPCAWCLLVAAGCGGCWLVARRRRHAPAPLWGPYNLQKATKINIIHKIHALQFQVCVFFEGRRRRQLGHRCAWLGDYEIVKHVNIHKVQKSRGVFF